VAKKPPKRVEYREVVYDAKRWTILKKLRERAKHVMEALESAHIESIVHGSIARGDVTEKSDIDVFLRTPVSSFAVETALERAGIQAEKRLVVQATPTYAMKAHVEIGENTSVSFPLMKMRTVEREFYGFGGEITLEDLRRGLRVPGVDKRLMIIEPTVKGHRESTIVGCEDQVAQVLGVSVETVLDRVRALLRRDEVGRTGVFLEDELSPDETFEMALKRLAVKNPAVRRRCRSA
jgi:predicted nucleotidyltransferase